MIGHDQRYCGPPLAGFEVVIQANTYTRITLTRQQTVHRLVDQIGLAVIAGERRRA